MPRWRTLIIPAGFVLVYLYAFPYFERLRSANEVPRVMLTQEIVRNGTFRLDARWIELVKGSTFDVATTCGEPPRARQGGKCPAPVHRYSNKAPGASFLAVPGMLAARDANMRTSTWIARVTAVTLPCLLFLPFFFGVARRFGDEVSARGALVAYALGSMALPYGILFFSHAIAAAAAGGAFACAVRLVRGGGGHLAALGCGLLAGAAVVIDYQSALAALAVGIYLLWRSPRRVRHGALALAGTIPPVVLLFVYHAACFGSPLRTGYSFAEDVAHKQGVLGIIGPNGEAMWNALLAPDNGLFVLMPWVLLAIVGAVVIWRDPEARARCGPEAIVCAAVVVAYILFLGSLVPDFGRAGWSVGPRYIGVALPFAAWLATAGLQAADRRAGTRVVAHALVLVGVIVYVVAATTFPQWSTSIRNPLHQVSFRILAEDLAPHSLGTAVGLRGFVSLLPLYVVVVALVTWLLGWTRARLATTAAALAVAVGIVAAYGWFPRSDSRPHWNQTIVRVWEPR